jgi:hypothetical protein
MPSTTINRTMGSFDRIAATLAALVIVGLAVFLLVRNQPIADPRLFFVLRAVISFSAAALGATIPGFLDLRWSGGGLVVRAGGALARIIHRGLLSGVTPGAGACFFVASGTR